MINEDIKSIQQLLNQVGTISKTYDLVAKSTGENFNLFRILGMETAEVKTHSRFLAELLNPKGSHLQGDAFLKLFISYLNNIKLIEENNQQRSFLKNRIELNSENAKIEVEKYIGRKIDEKGGRIDICITDSVGDNIICIENKIYAGEQDKQMQRYDNYAKKFKNRHLFFLTLWGNETKTNGKELVYPISYKIHIIEWLELCKKEAVNLPILRESIGQYINLIKKLTHQTINKNMEKDLHEIILKNYDESSLIYENYEKSVFNLYNSIIRELADKIKQYLRSSDWEVFQVGEIKSTKDRGLIFIKPKNLAVTHGFGIEEFNPLCRYFHFNHRIFYGLVNWEKDTKFIEEAKDLNKNNTNGGWINYEFPESKNFDFSAGTDSLIKYVIEETKRNQCVEEIFICFRNYFDKNQNGYLRYLEGLDKDK